MPDQIPSKKSLQRDLTPLWLLIALIAITVLHDETVPGSALLHEISQRLYYLPMIYAAYRYGLRGGLTASLVSAAFYFPHIVNRSRESHPIAIGDGAPSAPSRPFAAPN